MRVREEEREVEEGRLGRGGGREGRGRRLDEGIQASHIAKHGLGRRNFSSSLDSDSSFEDISWQNDSYLGAVGSRKCQCGH